MELSFLNDYIILVILGICLCIGYILKHLVLTDRINKFIPLIMGVIGLTLNIWLSGWKASPEIILGGLVSGLASTGIHQATKIINNKQSH